MCALIPKECIFTLNQCWCRSIELASWFKYDEDHAGIMSLLG
jgi:hypothetical protein